MSNKQQTAVEWLEIELEKLWVEKYLSPITIKPLLDKAKEMEKERMKGMYVEGSFAKMRYYDGLEYIDAEHFYKETYGGNK
jgi:hypothetical protein